MEQLPDKENELDQSFDYEPVLSQQIDKISHIPYTPANRPPSALEALLKLTGAKNSQEIGLTGPALAARVSERNKHLAEFNAYQEIYPRDAHKVAQILWPQYPDLTKSTILSCLPYTGTIDNLSSTDWIDEQEVGKIPHQVRAADHPRSKDQYEIRKRGYPYYGAVDTTQKNILAISRVVLSGESNGLSFLSEEYQDTNGESHTVLDGLSSNLNWVLSRAKFNPEGLIESIQANPKHHANQSWADSPDSFHHANGELARHHPDQNLGVASVEVNAETYDAMQAGISIYQEILKNTNSKNQELIVAKIKELENASSKLKQSLLDNFWVKDDAHHGGYFARGTDRDKNGDIHPLKIRSSDMGHLLLSSVLDDDPSKVESVVKNLFSSEMLAANGIRTLSSDSVRYHKDAYHNGAVWPWDTYTIALGLEKHGYHGLAKNLEDRIMNFYHKTNTLAEYGTGDDKDLINLTRQVTIFDPSLNSDPIDQYSKYNVIQPPQEIQAWTVATVLDIKFKRAQRAKDPSSYPISATDPAKAKLENEILKNIAKK